MGKEFELKYAASPETLEKIGSALEGGTVWRMATTYYDTPNRDFSARGWTFRLRRENEKTVVTLKTPAGGSARREGEWESSSLTEAAAQLVAMGAPGELEAFVAAGVSPVCGAEFTRRAIPVSVEGGAVEVALDQGRLFREDREMPLCEVEVELKEGSESAAVAYARDLAETYGLTPEPRSKFARAFYL